MMREKSAKPQMRLTIFAVLRNRLLEIRVLPADCDLGCLSPLPVNPPTRSVFAQGFCEAEWSASRNAGSLEVSLAEKVSSPVLWTNLTRK
jgi:hypothetical protein